MKSIKKISVLIALALIVTISGVYATWNYAQGDAEATFEALDSVTVITDKVVDAVAKGNISIDVSNLLIKIDDSDNNHIGELYQEGYVEITFTPSAGADASVIENGIALQYQLSCTGSDFTYNGEHIFEYSSDPVVLNDGNPVLKIRIPAADLGISLKNEIYLPTAADYDAFKLALASGSLIITISEYEG